MFLCSGLGHLDEADESEGLARERAEAAAGVVQALQAEKVGLLAMSWWLAGSE